MIKTVNNTMKQDKEKYQIPGKVQDIIPVRTVYSDGIFLSGKGKYSKTFRFRDINYAVASRSDKEMMFLEYSELLNAFDSGATTKITINNRRLNRLDFENQILIGMKNDGLNEYRKEYNSMLLDKATGSNAIVQDKYVTVSVSKNNIEDARVYFSRIGADLVAHFARLGSQCTELDAEERLRIIHDFFRTGEETYFNFDMKVWALEYQPVGFVVLHKQQALDYFAEEQKKPYVLSGRDPADRLHRYYWEITQRVRKKPSHPGENDDFLPDEIRGKHYNSWTEIAKDLGYKEEDE